jgi:hypothetical protein
MTRARSPVPQERATTVHFDDVEDKAGLFARHRREHFGPETMRDIKARPTSPAPNGSKGNRTSFRHPPYARGSRG